MSRIDRASRAYLLLVAFLALWIRNASAQSAHYGGTQTTVTSDVYLAGIAVDAANNVYVVDPTKPGVLMETPSGAGYTETVIRSRLFGNVVGVAVDGAGNLYVINDGQACTLIKLTRNVNTYSDALIATFQDNACVGVAVTSDGVSVYVADNEDSGYVYQYANVAGTYVDKGTVVFGVPGIRGIATDSSGAWYVLGNGKIMTHSPGFSGFTFSGTTLVSGLDSTAAALTIDSSGDFFIADTANNRILEEIPVSGSYMQSVVASQFKSPIGIAVASNGVIFATNSSMTNSSLAVALNPAPLNFGAVAVGSTSTTQTMLFVFDTAGGLDALTPYQALLGGASTQEYVTVIGSGTTCIGQMTFSVGNICSVSVTFTPAFPGKRNGVVRLNSAVQLNGSSALTVAAAFMTGTGLGPQAAFAPVQSLFVSGLNGPAGVALDGAGNVYIADAANNRVLKEVRTGGTYTQSVIATGFTPAGIAVDGVGNVYVADPVKGILWKEVYAGGTYTQHQFVNVSSFAPVSINGVAVDSAGSVYVSTNESKFQNDGSLLKITPRVDGTLNIIPIASLLNDPDGVAVDSAGNVYVSDSDNGRVLKEAFAGGTYTQSVILTGLHPTGLAVDGGDNLYVADSMTNRVLKVVYANGTYTPSVIATGLDGPNGIAVDVTGNVYISDSGNNQVLLEKVEVPPSLSFASTPVGTTSSDSPQAVVVSNNGNQPLAVTAVTSPAPNFLVDSSACLASSIPAGTSCTLLYSYTPTREGTQMASSRITDNTQNVSSFQFVPLQGAAATIRTQSITFQSPAGTGWYLSGTAVPVSATSSAGLPVSFSVTTTGTVTARLSGNVVILGGSGTGTVAITASQNGNQNYAAAASVTDSFTVTIVTSLVDGDVWLVNKTGSLSSFNNSHVTGSGPFGVATQASSTGGLAFDASGHAWSVISGSNFLSSVTSSGTNAMIYTGAGINAPNAVAIDGAGQVWVANGSGSVSEFTNGGAALSPSTGYTGITTAPSGGATAFSNPTGVSIDISGNVWVTNATSNTVAEILGAAAPAAPLATALTNSTTGVRP